MEKILIIDDENSIRKSLGLLLGDSGFKTMAAESAEAALAAMESFSPDLVILDLNLPGMQGLEALSKIHEAKGKIPVIVFSGTGDIGKAVRAMKQGAFDFLEKPVRKEDMLESVGRALALKRLERENRFLREQYLDKMGLGSVVVHSDALAGCLETARKFASAPDVTVLITGESGTGKEVVARYIHCHSARFTGPFTAINCAALPAGLQMSELFGYAPGSFTDARKGGARGRLDAAAGGTLFLDEIGEMAPETQAAMLRVLQDRSFYPVGSAESRSLDCRVVCATNRDLAEMSETGSFRSDLLFRIRVGEIRLPSLRDCRAAIMPLALSFIERFSQLFDRAVPPGIDPSAADALNSHPWPGNVRELMNCMERCVLLSSDSITLDLVRESLGGGTSSLGSSHDSDLHGMKLPDEGFDIEKLMLKVVAKAYVRCGYDINATARYLGLTREALKYRLKRISYSS